MPYSWVEGEAYGVTLITGTGTTFSAEVPRAVITPTFSAETFWRYALIAMSGATPSDAGLASGLINTTAQVGGALGLAVLATLSASRSDRLIGDGESAAAALTSGYHLAFGIGAGLVVVAIAVALTVLRTERQAEEEIQAEPAGCEAA